MYLESGEAVRRETEKESEVGKSFFLVQFYFLFSLFRGKNILMIRETENTLLRDGNGSTVLG